MYTVLEQRFSACELRVAAISSTVTIEDEHGIFLRSQGYRVCFFFKHIGFQKFVASRGSLERLTITFTANRKFEDYL